MLQLNSRVNFFLADTRRDPSLAFTATRLTRRCLHCSSCEELIIQSRHNHPPLYLPVTAGCTAGSYLILSYLDLNPTTAACSAPPVTIQIKEDPHNFICIFQTLSIFRPNTPHHRNGPHPMQRAQRRHDQNQSVVLILCGKPRCGD